MTNNPILTKHWNLHPILNEHWGLPTENNDKAPAQEIKNENLVAAPA